MSNAATKPYSLREALLSEIKANPYRSILSTLAVVPFVVAAVTYFVDRWFPDPSYAFTAPLNLQLGSDDRYRSDLQLATSSETPIKRIVGKYAGADKNGRLSTAQSFDVAGDFSLSSNPQLQLEFEKLPDFILLCLNVENTRGASVSQDIILLRPDEKKERQYLDFVLFKPLALSVKRPLSCQSLR
jgi:hypothetical protein